MSAMWDLGDTEDDSAHVEETMAYGHYEGSGRATGTREGARPDLRDRRALPPRPLLGPARVEGLHRPSLGRRRPRPELSFSGLIAITSAGDENTGGVVQGGFLARGTDVEPSSTSTASSTSSPTG